MNVYLLAGGEKLPVTPMGDKAMVAAPCPVCGSASCYIQGTGSHISSDDRAYAAQAISLCCKKRVGTIRAEMDTLFGVEEDERVLSGPCKVY